MNAIPGEIGGATPHCTSTIESSILNLSVPPTGGHSQSQIEPDEIWKSSLKVPWPGIESESWTLNASKLIPKSSVGRSFISTEREYPVRVENSPSIIPPSYSPALVTFSGIPMNR